MNARMQDISQAYALHYTEWKAYLQEYANGINRLLEEHQMRFSVKYRVKSLESLSEKESFLLRQNKETLIKDLLGLRVVVPFQEGVEQVINLLRQQFQIQDIERKSEQLSFREFAYDSVHIEIPLKEEIGIPALCKPVIEVQVRTILQDAWAEVEHELIYKNHFRFPNNESIRKKLAALNASLTLSDMIFQEIRDSQKEMEKWGKGRFRALIDKAVDFQGPALSGQGNGNSIDIENHQHVPLEPERENSDIRPEREEQQFPQTQSLPQASRAEIERLLMAALKAHNEQDYRTAIHYYTMVLELNPELKVRSVVFSHRGMAHFMLQHESQALSDFDRSFYCDKTNFRSLNYRAMVLRRMGYVEEALECFAHSLEIQDNQAEVFFLRSQTLFEIEREAEAFADLTRALELEPDNDEAQRLMEQMTARRNVG